MAVTLKFLSRAVAKTQQVVATSPRIIGEATPKTPKTPLSSPSRFSPLFEEFSESGKQVLSGSPSKLAPLPLVPEMPGGPRSLDYGETLRWSPEEVWHWSENSVIEAQRERRLQRQKEQDLPSAGLSPAELARQSFLARRGGGLAAGLRNTAASEHQRSEGGCVGGYPAEAFAPQRKVLLGRGEDASSLPACGEEGPKLPVLLGQTASVPRQVPNYDDKGNAEIAAQVREAFLARQGRIRGRVEARKVS